MLSFIRETRFHSWGWCFYDLCTCMGSWLLISHNTATSFRFQLEGRRGNGSVCWNPRCLLTKKKAAWVRHLSGTNFIEDVLKIFTGQPLPGFERGSQNHFGYSPSTSCSQTEVTALLVKAWVGSHGAGAESLLFFDYSHIFFQFFSLPSCQHEHLLRLLSSPKTQTFKDGAERDLGLRINSGWEKCGLVFCLLLVFFSFGDRSRAVQQSLIIC